MAAALVDMAAKGLVKIEQTQDLVTVTRLVEMDPGKVEPEEDSLSWHLFRNFDCFDFAQSTPQLAKATEAFRSVLLNTGYFRPHVGLSIPAWAVSGIASAIVFLPNLHMGGGSGRGLGYAVALTVSCFVVAVRTLPGTIEKVACWIPGSTTPKRPWTGADTRPLGFLAGGFVGLGFLGLLSDTPTALLLGAFMVVNAVFFFALQGPSAKGREILDQLEDYKKFLSAVAADPVSRMEPSDRVPAHLDVTHAYAIAFHLDLGWGEQFVTSIANVVECAEVFDKPKDDEDAQSLTES